MEIRRKTERSPFSLLFNCTQKTKKNCFDGSQAWISRIESMNLECCDVPVGAEVENHEVRFVSHRYNFYLDCKLMTIDE
jgi:hypothetical protein